jgi:hypothetical protein
MLLLVLRVLVARKFVRRLVFERNSVRGDGLLLGKTGGVSKLLRK